MTKIDIISGFLGAGKTTLIKKLLKEALNGQKVVLIENEFGEIGIDGGFLKDAGIEITEMNSGCICCSLVGDFSKALQKVLEEYSPERIIIEPSGVGKLSDVIKATEGVLSEQVVLNSFTTVVDATKCKMYMKNFGEFFNNQVESATTIVLSRTANMDEVKLSQTVDMLREHNEKASIITTDWSIIEGSLILKEMENKKSLVDEMMDEEDICPVCGHHHHDDDDDEDEHECHHHHHDDEDDEDEHECHHHHHDDEEDEDEHECHHHHDHEDDHEHHCCHDHEGHHHHHHADEVFVSWGKETPKRYSKDTMENILKTLSNSEEYGVILRAKGMVMADDNTWIYFDLVPGEYELREGSPEVTGKLCVIGSKLKEEELSKLFLL